MKSAIEILKREMKKQHLNASELSRKLGLHQTSIQGILSRETIQVQRLADLCKAMQFNFFRELAEQFPFEEPVIDNVHKQKVSELNEEINLLKEDNKILTIKVEVLNGVIEKIG